MRKSKKLNPIEHFEEIISKGPRDRDRSICNVGKRENTAYTTAKRISLENGGTISVQAGVALYCTPRNGVGPYKSVEVGFPEGVRIPSTWDDYKDGDGSGIYAWVPVKLVRDLILANCPKLRAELEKKDKELEE